MAKSLEKVADLEHIVAAREATWDSYKEEEAEKVVQKKQVCGVRMCACAYAYVLILQAFTRFIDPVFLCYRLASLSVTQVCSFTVGMCAIRRGTRQKPAS